MNSIFFDDDRSNKFDQLALERAVKSLSKTQIRPHQLSVEKVRTWVMQFDTELEKSLAWLILRHLVYRTTMQLESSLRQALKGAAKYFLELSGNSKNTDWKKALAGDLPGLNLTFYCGPPIANEFSPPGKSGEIVTRNLHRNYRIKKAYPRTFNQFTPDERYLVVDDGTYTGQQLIEFLESWQANYSQGQVAIVVGLAHTNAVNSLKTRFPKVPIFFGELLTEKNSLLHLSNQWVQDGQWPTAEISPRDAYINLFNKKGPFSNKSAPEGFGSLGLMVGFEHGIPDDSLQLLWDKSPNWKPLIER